MVCLLNNEQPWFKSLTLSYFRTYFLLFCLLFVTNTEEDAFFKNLFILLIRMERVKWVSKYEGQFCVSKSYPDAIF